MEIKYEEKDIERVVLEDFKKNYKIHEGMEMKVHSGYNYVTIFVTERKVIDPQGDTE